MTLRSTGDTPPSVARRWREMVLERSGAERLVMGCALFEASRALLRAGLRERGEVPSGTSERAEILRRTYPDLDARTRDAVIERLRSQA